MIVNEDNVFNVLKKFIVDGCKCAKPEIMEAIFNSKESKALVLYYCSLFLDLDLPEDIIYGDIAKDFAPFMAGYRAAIEYIELQLH